MLSMKKFKYIYKFFRVMKMGIVQLFFDENDGHVNGDLLIGLLEENMIFRKKLQNINIILVKRINSLMDRLIIKSIGRNAIGFDIGDRNIYIIFFKKKEEKIKESVRKKIVL